MGRRNRLLEVMRRQGLLTNANLLLSTVLPSGLATDGLDALFCDALLPIFLLLYGMLWGRKSSLFYTLYLSDWF